MHSITPVRDPISEPIAALLDLFGTHAQALRFPEIDHSTLEALATSLREGAAEVQRCEQALADARRVLDERREALQGQATRGLAYARIYAQDDADLRASLDAIDLSPRRKAARGGAKKPPRRVARARRTKAGDADESVTELPFAEPSSPAQAGVA